MPTAVSGGTSINVTGVNSFPTIQINGGTAFTPSIYFAPSSGSSTCALLALPPGNWVHPGDSVTINEPAGWLNTGLGAVGSYSGAVTNAVNQVPPPQAAITPSLRPGYNIYQPWASNDPMVMHRNLRYRLAYNTGVAARTADGYPTQLSSAGIFAYVFSASRTNALPGDSTASPGTPGYWGVAFTDAAYGGGNQTNITLQQSTGSTITPVSGYTTTRVAGTPQYAIYKVVGTGALVSGQPTANIPVYCEWQMPSFSAGVNAFPQISNLFIVPPRDLYTRYAGVSATLTNGSTTVTFSQSMTALTSLNLTVENDSTVGLYTILSGSGTTWTLATSYGGSNTTTTFWGTLPAYGPLTIDTSQPYALSRYFTDAYSGSGCFRWMDAQRGGSGCNDQAACTWEKRGLADFSYASGTQWSLSVSPTTARPLAIGSYFYGDFFGAGSSYTSASTVGSGSSLPSISTPAGSLVYGTLKLSSATGTTDPICYGQILNLGGTEWVRVYHDYGDGQTYKVQRNTCAYSIQGTSPNNTAYLPPTTAPPHIAGESITIYSRVLVTSINALGGAPTPNATQVAEFVCSTPHHLSAGPFVSMTRHLRRTCYATIVPHLFIRWGSACGQQAPIPLSRSASTTRVVARC